MPPKIFGYMWAELVGREPGAVCRGCPQDFLLAHFHAFPVRRPSQFRRPRIVHQLHRNFSYPLFLPRSHLAVPPFLSTSKQPPSFPFPHRTFPPVFPTAHRLP
ncbi:hypothetical protein M427DRAFT_440915 [Gonapodya prolifera JEL478]|uniref:Uncharacterized protein n=1 Tax=Gonapodya prolifera (strain JEL478) TaxID=1344416 RepID=A0A139A483_GONPJ|nr:hypothetical protein M427DRAFT_440915 [Gonapodya prolifera JEL478]|eukprot:KXS11285.1 hypothetical protein M427DRAFT_440915 [Gonapodya prolifera JEL478]